MTAKSMQKARAGMSVSDDDIALYTAARAFLFGEWAGALLMVASFTQLFFLGLRSDAYATASVIIGLVLLVLGAFIFWTSRTYFFRLGVAWRKNWELAAVMVAGSGVVFWLLFGLLWLLVWNDVPIQN